MAKNGRKTLIINALYVVSFAKMGTTNDTTKVVKCWLSIVYV